MGDDEEGAMEGEDLHLGPRTLHALSWITEAV